MPLPATLDLTIKGHCIYRGEKPYEVDLIWHDDDVDFTGCNGKSQVKDRQGNLLFDFVVTFPEVNVCRLSYPDTETLQPIRGAEMDLFITYTNGEIMPEVRGVLDIVDRVTER